MFIRIIEAGHSAVNRSYYIIREGQDWVIRVVRSAQGGDGKMASDGKAVFGF